MLLHDLIDHQARRAPDAPALVMGATELSFGTLAARVERVAAVVEALTAPGDRVAYVGENSMAWVECYYAVPRAGRVLAFVNHRLAPPEMARVLARSGATLLIGSPGCIEPLRPHARSFPAVATTLDLDGYEGHVRRAAPHPPVGRRSDDPAWLIYTSGTTGTPKGALLTHASLLAAVEVTGASRPMATDDVYLFPFPLCHIAGYNVLNHHLRGRPVVLLPRFDPADFAEATLRHEVTTTSLAATMLGGLLDHLDEDHLSLPSLRSVAYGAAPMPPSLMARADDALGVELAQGYGMTELSGNAVFLDAAAHRRGLSGDPRLLRAAGRPGPGVAVRVVDDEDRDVATGEVGELVVRGAQVMAGYLDDDAATVEALRSGWLHTGDVGRRDEEGWLYVVDRKKDVIITGGENVSSREVEDALHAHPDVREAAVIGAPDPRWGENVCALVVPRPGRDLDPADVVDSVRSQLAGFKRPRHVVLVDSLPKNATGKVQKAELRRLLAEHPEILGERG